MFSLLRISLTLGLLCLSASTASARAGEELRLFLGQLSSNFLEIGKALDSPSIVEKSHQIAASNLCSPIPDDALLAAQARDMFPRILDRLDVLSKRLAERKSAAKAKAESDWPVAECDLSNSENGDWAEFRNDLLAAAGLKTSLASLELYCKRPKVRAEGIEATALTLQATCHADPTPDYAHGSGHIRVDEPAVARWPSVHNCVEVCATLETASLLPAELVAELQETWLGCQRDGYITASYKRLEYLRDELAALDQDLDFLIRFQTETSLQIWGGSRIAALYLPEALGGRLETVASAAQSAVDETEDAGYIVSPRIHAHLQKAAGKAAAGSYKDAFDLYREAYEEVTAGSPKRVRR